MNNSREKFEEALNNCILETQCLLEYDEFTTRDIAHFIWQAATEQSRKEIAELEAKLNELVKFQSSADRLAKAQAESLNTIAELKAREKVLVKALKSAKPIYATARNTKAVKTGHELGGYVKDYLVSPHILHNALANVRGEL